MRILGSSALAVASWRAIAIGRRRAAATFGFLTAAVLIVAIGLTACSRSGKRGDESNRLSKRVVEIGERAPKGGGHYKVGNPYQIKGRWYRPKEQPKYNEVGIASWYGDLFHGRYTSNGEVFDMESLTAAHPTLPMPTYAEVTNLKNGRTIVVRINDRGPYAHDRVIDLSKRSARELGVFRPGTARVRVRYLGKAPLNGDDTYERQVLASQPWARYAAGKPSTKTASAAGKSALLFAASTKKPLTKSDKLAIAATPTVRKVAAPGRSNANPRRQLVFVQAAAFRSKASADSVRRKLSGLGQVHVFPAEVAGTIWYRVRLGPFREDLRARDTLKKVVAAGAPGAHIVRN